MAPETPPTLPQSTSPQATSPYVVLARKYRPLSFANLVGQDAMVKTLTNAFASGRIHHAFMLTGVRGVGKTTTARILARAFNFEDGNGARPSLDLETEGVHDRAIIEGRHVDVIEMDAASNTSINDIREIIESIRYAPASAPYKVYIIDEVHMLSGAAFNGLLKTLEEPPPYVKFIFATTEIRKVPVTILSRCMRFDLRRVPADTMTTHLTGILAQESIGFEPEALAMIVRAGEGSVRDSMSLLDQAIAQGGGGAGAAITADAVKAMLGLADRAAIIDLFEALMAGRPAEALDILDRLYIAGADPQMLIGDLTDLANLVTRLKIVPAAASDASLTPDERSRGADLASRLGMRVLTRAWQILFKGHEEVGQAANAIGAAQMVLVRLAYAADLPTPDELAARLTETQSSDAPPSLPPRPQGGGGGGSQALRSVPMPVGHVAPPVQVPSPDAPPGVIVSSYADIVALAARNRDVLLKIALESQMRPVSFAEGRLEVALVDGGDPGVIGTLSARLKAWTGRSWLVTVSSRAPEGQTISQQKAARDDAAATAAREDPLVKAVLENFPGSRLVNVIVRETTGDTPDLQPDPMEDD